MMSTAKTLTKRAKYQFCVLNTFIKQWQQDYLLSLRERRAVQTRRADAAPVKEGDIVILKEDGTARALWKLARVVETLEGRGGLIRAARVQLLSNDKTIYLRRPIQHDSFRVRNVAVDILLMYLIITFYLLYVVLITWSNQPRECSSFL